MHVAIYNTQKRFPIDSDIIAKVACAVVKAEGVYFDEVSIHFVGKQKICKLHADYFDDPSPTDCISFPLDNNLNPGYTLLGDVFVCPEAAFHFVKLHGGNIHEEICLYVVHGLLHLLGYDDIKDKDRMIMRQKEQFHMANIKGTIICT